MRRPGLTLLLLCCASLDGAGCNHDAAGHGPGAPITDLASITITPADQTLVIDGTTAATSAYSATGTFKDGHSEPLRCRADAAFFSGDMKASEADYARLIALGSADGSAQFQRAMANYALGRWREAVPPLERSRTLSTPTRSHTPSLPSPIRRRTSRGRVSTAASSVMSATRRSKDSTAPRRP